MTLQLGSIFSDSAVLQRDMAIRIWGTGSPNETVKVSLGSDDSQTTVSASGHWRLELPPMSATTGLTLTASSGDETIECNDVAIGEVWLCSGQSNMAFILGAAEGGRDAAKLARDPDLRVMTVDRHMAVFPCDQCSGKWMSADGSKTHKFSAVGYHFGRMLRETLGVPVGLVVAAVGHTPAEAWISREAIGSESAFPNLLLRFDALVASTPGATEDLVKVHESRAKEWAAYDKVCSELLPKARKAWREGRPIPFPPKRPTGPADWQSPTVLFNGMIHPLAPMSMRGVTWYQGETDAIYDQSRQYRKLFPMLIRDWRRQFESPNLTWLYVQLAAHADVQGPEPWRTWPGIREAQRQAQNEPNTGMIVTIDLGEVENIHPLNKRDVGLRLARAALAKCYDRPVTWRGPVLIDAVPAEGGRCRLTFDHVDAGLQLRLPATDPDKAAGIETGFEVANDSGKFHPAEVQIVGDNQIEAWCDVVHRPHVIRYAWTDAPIATLFNSVGLPAGPFSQTVRRV